MATKTGAKIRVEKLGPEELKRQGVFSWPVWEKEVSRFDWTYDSEEQCYFLEGRVTVRAGEETAEIRAGDFVTFPRGTRCVWEIHEPVRKHYRFR